MILELNAPITWHGKGYLSLKFMRWLNLLSRAIFVPEPFEAGIESWHFPMLHWQLRASFVAQPWVGCWKERAGEFERFSGINWCVQPVVNGRCILATLLYKRATLPSSSDLTESDELQAHLRCDDKPHSVHHSSFTSSFSTKLASLLSEDGHVTLKRDGAKDFMTKAAVLIACQVQLLTVREQVRRTSLKTDRH